MYLYNLIYFKIVPSNVCLLRFLKFFLIAFPNYVDFLEFKTNFPKDKQHLLPGFYA